MGKYLKNDKGSVLVMVLIIMLVATVLGTTLLQVSVAETKFSEKNEDKSQAYYIARAGAESVAKYMISDGEGIAEDIIGKTSSFEFKEGSGTVQVIDSGDHIEILSEGNFNGVKQEARLIMRESEESSGSWPAGSIIVKDKITTDGNGNGIVIEGPIVVGNNNDGSVSLGSGEITIEGETVSIEDGVVHDPDLIIDSINIPDSYDNEEFATSGITSDEELIIGESGHTTFNVNYIEGNNTITVSGEGSAHVYITGSKYINSEKEDYAIYTSGSSEINILGNAKLYVYVLTDANVKIIGKGIEGKMFLHAPDSVVEWNNANDDFKGVIIANEVILHNNIEVDYDKDIASGSDSGFPTIGISYSGYSWADIE
jgi:hypothetical protein